jgi:hypothetical protein
MKVARTKTRSRNGIEHEQSALSYDNGICACTIKLDEAEKVAREILRLATEQADGLRDIRED